MQPLETSDIEAIAFRLGLRPAQVARTLELLGEGNTVPYIARYLQDETEGLGERDIRGIRRLAQQFRELVERKGRLIGSLKARGKLTPELHEQISKASSQAELNDFVAAAKGDKKGPAAEALKKGLGILADAILEDRDDVVDLQAAAASYVDAERGLASVEDVLNGAEAILARRFAESYQVRRAVRTRFHDTATVVSKQAKRVSGALQRIYGTFFDFRCPLQRLEGYKALHLLRAERRRIVSVEFEVDVDGCVAAAWEQLGVSETHRQAERLRAALRRSVSEIILPQLTESARRELRERAREFLLELIERHVRTILMQPPLRGERVLGIDPGLRTGCKCVALDSDGNPQDFIIVYPHEPLRRWDEAKQKLVDFIKRHQLTVAAIGNGTGCRETEALLAEIITESLPDFRFTVVNEVGADDYAKSEAGREEFPDRQPEFRSATSVGRRLLDPLSEFVKVDPRKLCEDLVQNDMDAAQISEYVQEVIASCVNEVGADVNRANPHLLKYIAGLNLVLARKLVNWRKSHGGFQARRQLLLVDQNLNEHRFIQCAGFLRIYGGEDPIEATPIHPKHYDVAAKLLERAGALPDEVISGRAAARLDDLLSRERVERLAEQFGVGPYTLRLIVDSLKRPFADPRLRYRPAVFKRKVLKLEDLKPGMELDGVVQNVVDFGAFVDVGVEVTGLVHVSRMGTDFIDDPHQAVTVGQPVRVWVHEVDLEKQRLALSMVEPGKERQRRRRPPEAGEDQRTRPRRPRRPVRSARARAGRAEEPVLERRSPAPVAAGSNGAEVAAAAQPVAPTTQNAQGEQLTRAAARPAKGRSRSAKPKREARPVELPEEVVTGKEPLRSFAELKALWERLQSGESGNEQ